MKILIIANCKDAFGRAIRDELAAKNIDASLLDFESLRLYDKDNIEKEKYSNLFSKYKKIPKLSMFFRMLYIKKIIQENKFDILNIHISRWVYLIILSCLTKQKLVITFYGSDFYRTSNFIKNIQKIMYKKADALTFTNPLTKDSFLNYYKDFDNKTFVCRFGLTTLDFIDKNRIKNKSEIKNHFGYSQDKMIITCGYNATKAQQHEKIIENLVKLPKELLQGIQFIFPMTYGDNKYKEKIKNILKDTDLDYIVLEDFLYADENAYIKLASDIMINVLETDSFSGSMQEFLYAGNIVITGNWLPYDVLDGEGIVYFKIDAVDDLREKLEYIIKIDTNSFVLKQNKHVIYKLSSWESNIHNWINVYEKLSKHDTKAEYD